MMKAELPQVMIDVSGISKSFTLHLRDGAVLPVLSDVNFAVTAGECAVLGGVSGIGKSSLLRMIFGNYAADAGRIDVRDGAEMVDVVTASPRRIVDLRRHAMSYVSQFLRVIPRVGSLDIVTRAALEVGLDPSEARGRSQDLLSRLKIPKSLWTLPPATFSGGEQQRINLARSFVVPRPIMLLDEPTASLDAANRQVVIGLIRDAKATGTSILGIFHDEDVRGEVADRIIDITQFKPRRAPTL
jgi:alpha-D-ribose 1-methylphosphonate 5-triphosphate synthase subunit PhnL